MTSTKGGTYAGQYPCGGWVDNPEPTLSTEVYRTRNNREIGRLEPNQEPIESYIAVRHRDIFAIRGMHQLGIGLA